MKSQRKGFTLTELIVLITCTALLLGMTAIITSCGSDDPSSRTESQNGETANRTTIAADDERRDTVVQPSVRQIERDATQLRSIFQACAVFSRDFDGKLPTPGLIRRKPINFGGEVQRIPGRGPEDYAQNTTANFYSALIAQNYITPSLVVSLLERNPVVKEATDYNWDIYSPIQAVYWDDAFKANLETGSNASYAHLVLHGQRRERMWRTTQGNSEPVLSNRGPLGGQPDPASYTTDDTGQWSGHVVTNDGSVKWHKTMTPQGITYIADDGTPRQDNIFAVEDGWGGTDAILSFTLEIGGDEPVIQHD